MIRLQQLRLDAGMSINDLAAEARVGRLTIRRIEESGQAMHVAPLTKLAEHFGVQPSELLMPAISPSKEAA